MMPSVKTLQLIDQKWLDRVVILAEETMKSTKVYGKICENGHWNPPSNTKCLVCRKRASDILQRAQLSNFQNLTNSTDSVKAMELFVRYQMGRKEGKGWRYQGESDLPFGFRVINDFNQLGKWAEEIARESGEIDLKPIHLWLIRLYCGFLNRWFVAFKGGEEEVEAIGEE